MKPKHITINEIIAEQGFVNYLEIGTAANLNFNAINCVEKTGVEPSLEIGLENQGVHNIFPWDSDTFFKENTDKFDIVFIDGDHSALQVERDIINAWNCLHKGGVIILHDVNPPTKEHQVMPRQQLSWTGDVWRAFVGFKKVHPKIETNYFEEKYGLGVIWKSGHKLKETFADLDMPWLEFSTSKSLYLGYDK
jgi:hypothetical protein